MSFQPSKVALSILTLLNNVEELIAKSNNRQDAQDVMKALVVYANSKNYQIPLDKVDNFFDILLDSRPNTLSFAIRDIANDIVSSERKDYLTKLSKRKLIE